MPIIEYTDFSGGINQQIGPVITGSTQQQGMFYADDAKNFEMSQNGILKYKGYAKLLNSALSGTPTITGAFEYFTSAGVRELIVCAGGKVFKVSGGSATQIYTGHTAGYFYQGTTYKGTLILCNGFDVPLQYDGSTCTTITFIDPNTIWDDARPYGMVVFRGRCFYWDDTKVYTPKPDTFNDFNNNGNTVDGFVVDQGYGGNITRLQPLTDDALIIYKQRCIRRLSGSAPFGQPDQFTITPLSDDVGCLSGRSVVQVGIDHYFWSERGPRRLQTVQAYGDVNISQPSYNMPAILETVNWSYASNICGVHDPNTGRVWWSYATGASTTNSDIVVLDTDTQTIEPRYTGITAASICYFNRQIVHGDYGGLVYNHGTTNAYDSASIESYWKSKYIAHNGIGTYKRYRRLTLYSEADGSGDVTVRWTILRDGVPIAQNATASVDAGANSWDTGLWDSAVWSTSETKVFHIKNLGRGTAIKLELFNTSAVQRPLIRQINLEYEVFGTNRG